MQESSDVLHKNTPPWPDDHRGIVQQSCGNLSELTQQKSVEGTRPTREYLKRISSATRTSQDTAIKTVRINSNSLESAEELRRRLLGKLREIRNRKRIINDNQVIEKKREDVQVLQPQRNVRRSMENISDRDDHGEKHQVQDAKKVRFDQPMSRDTGNGGSTNCTTKILRSVLESSCKTQELVVSLPPVARGEPLKSPEKSNVAVAKRALPSISEKVKVLLGKTSNLYPPVFRFDISTEAAETNFKLLKENNFNLEKLLNLTQSVTTYGSEFKDVDDLHDILHRHPR